MPNDDVNPLERAKRLLDSYLTHTRAKGDEGEFDATVLEAVVARLEHAKVLAMYVSAPLNEPPSSRLVIEMYDRIAMTEEELLEEDDDDDADEEEQATPAKAGPKRGRAS